eukprot:CFRG4467T1
MSTATVQSAEVLIIQEIRQLKKGIDSLSVRTIGKVVEVNIQSDWVLIDHNSWELRVDTSLLEPLPFRNNSLFQFIGELQLLKEPTHTPTDDGCVVLKARIGRCVDGLDLGLYCEALMTRRKYLKMEDD